MKIGRMISKELVMDAYKKSDSVTHRHILSVINTFLKNEPALIRLPKVKILDAGCGKGGLIIYLQQFLPLFNEGIDFEIFGYDVVDHGVQESDYFISSVKNLEEKIPGIQWKKRIKFIHAIDNWPFDDNSFDIVISNQVLEHVWDHRSFFREQQRVLKDKGFSIHIFPVREVMFDGHIFMPIVHKSRSWDSMYRRIKFFSRLGIGVFKKEKSKFNNDINFFSRVWADKLYHYCNYKSFREFSEFAKDNHLCITTRFTYDYYRRRGLEILGFRPKFVYKYRPSSSFLFFFLKRISGICLTMYNGEYSSYRENDHFSTTNF